MKKIICLLVMASWASFTWCQTKIEKSVSVNSGQKVSMAFKWPDIVTIKTWDKNEIKITASVDINKGQNDDAFEFDIDKTGNVLDINSHIRNHDKLPKKILIVKDGEEFFFNTDKHNSNEIKEFKKTHGDDGFNYMNIGVIKDINIQMWIPQNIELEVYSKFGLVEIIGFDGKLAVHSKFGGVDIATSGNSSIKAGTKFGEKYTNLDSKIQPIAIGDRPGDWDWVSLGSGRTEQKVKTDFGNVYLRKL